MKKRIPFAPARLSTCAAALAVAGSASAAMTSANYDGNNGVEGLGQFTAVVTYNHVSGTTASLTILLTNTTSALYGGYITAVALSAAHDCTVSSMTASTMSAFSNLAGPVSASPWSSFQGGASTSDGWLGGGSPNGGIARGASNTFTFQISGTSAHLDAVTASTIFATTTGADRSGSSLAVRFRGMNNGGSDKVLSHIVPVPVPGAMALLGVAGLVGARRRRD